MAEIIEGERALVEGAQQGDDAAFRVLVEPLARELHVYAYRMLGGFQDAEDALQEARLRAWRGLGRYEPRTGFRAWMYRIVTNTSLDMLRGRRRRVLPRDVGPPVAPGPPATRIRRDIAWLEPYPDALLPVVDPEAAPRLRASVRLAFVHALQLLPARQRAALILHDVLDFAAAEVASMLRTSGAAIHGVLQRARATIAGAGGYAVGRDGLADHEADAVARLVRAWETGSVEHLVALLSDDTTLSMPPWIYWLDGRAAVAASLVSPETWGGAPRPGRYRLLPAAMNGQPAALAYVREPGDDGRFSAASVTVLTLDAEGRITAQTVFMLPERWAAWGFPAFLDDRARPRP